MLRMFVHHYYREYYTNGSKYTYTKYLSKELSGAFVLRFWKIFAMCHWKKEGRLGFNSLLTLWSTQTNIDHRVFHAVWSFDGKCQFDLFYHYILSGQWNMKNIQVSSNDWVVLLTGSSSWCRPGQCYHCWNIGYCWCFAVPVNTHE